MPLPLVKTASPVQPAELLGAGGFVVGEVAIQAGAPLGAGGLVVGEVAI